MVASLNIVPGDGRNPTVEELRKVKQQLSQLGNKSLSSISVTNTNGMTLLSIAPSGYTDSSGNPIVIVTLNDPISGHPILRQAPAVVSTAPNGTVEGSAFFWFMEDASGNQVIATDGLAGKGLAYPFENIAMYPYWNCGFSATPSGYATITASAIASTTVLWEGRVGYVSHPAISVDGVWGRASGTGAEIITYTLSVGGSSVGSWQVSGGLSVLKHTFDIHTLVGNLDSVVQLSAQSSITNADAIACQVLGVHLRQTPPVFG